MAVISLISFYVVKSAFINKCNSSLFKSVDAIWPIHRKEIQLCLRHLEVDLLEVIIWRLDPFEVIDLSLLFSDFQ
jgi:hypothetical protein